MVASAIKRRIAEGRLEARIGEHDGERVEGVLPAPDPHRELEGRDERHQEVERAEREGEPGAESGLLHRIHLSLRRRSQM